MVKKMEPEKQPKKTTTSKKKVVLKDNEHNLGHGFILTIVKHPIGDEFGNLEGFLSYQGNEIEVDTTYKRFYENVTDAMKDFDNRIIPAYLSENNNIKIFKYLDDQLMFEFVQTYLLKNKNKIHYGCVLDIIQILKEDGYEIPKNNDKAQVGNLLQFYKCVDRLSKEFKLQLRTFNFSADRNVNNTVDHPQFEKHIKCKNIVFTRYLWTNGYKAIATINDFVSITDNDLRDGIEMNVFKKKSPDAHKYLENILKMFNKVNLKTKDTLETLSYKEVKDEFKAYYKEHRKELVEYWSKQQPVNYGVYPVE